MLARALGCLKPSQALPLALGILKLQRWYVGAGSGLSTQPQGPGVWDREDMGSEPRAQT